MKLMRSFVYAWQGIQYCFKTQLNFRIHLIVLTIVTIAGFYLKISRTEWLLIIGCSMLVLALELINTALEQLCDVVTKTIHPSIKIIKDTSAAAVLVCAAGSVITGILIFLPKITGLLKL
ncbi:MAG: diacylglycerol kinase family protein [Ferruginibacter sp.]